MKLTAFALAAALVMVGGITCLAQTKTWTGSGDGFSWTNKSNWSGSTLPADTDTVGITSGSGTRVIISPGNDITVKSIQCSKPFVVSGGSLSLTAGSSSFSGSLTITNDAELSIDGSGVSVTASSTTVLADAWLYASDGAAIHLPNLYSVTNRNDNVTWHADGSGGTLDLASLTNITLGSSELTTIEANTGATVDLHRVTAAVGAVLVDAQDAGTVVNLSGLSGRWKSPGNSALSLKAQTGASISIPNVTQLENASLEVDNTGVIPTAQLNLLTNCTLTVDGATPNLGGVTNINESWLYAYDGGVARLTNVYRVNLIRYNATWDADGAGSKIDLSSVTNITQDTSELLSIDAYNGGAVDLHRVSAAAGAVLVDAQDAGTVVNLNGLSGRWKSPGNSALSLEAQTGATIIISNVTQLENGSLRVDNTGVIPTSQLNLLTNCTLTVDGATPNLGGVTNINESWVYAYEGGVARLTNVARVANTRYNATWHADGSGSKIDLSAVTILSLGGSELLSIEAYTGGSVDLHKASTAAGAVLVDAHDAGSVVNFSGLSGRWRSPGNSALSLQAQTGASILIPNVTQLENASLEVDNTGVIPTAQLNLLTNCTLTVDGATPNFTGLTNIDDTWLYAYDGGAAHLTNVLWVTVGNYNPVWHAENANSLIDLSRLNHISVGPSQILTVEAKAGGKVDLHALPGLCTGAVLFDASGSGSTINLSGLSGFISTGNSSSSLTAESSGTILLGTSAFLLGNVDISIPAGNPVLPHTVVASGGLTLYGLAWHSYWVEKRDTTSELNPWVFAARVPLTNSLQLFASAPAPNTDYQVWEFAADPPILDLSPATTGHFLLVVYDTTGKSNEVLKASSVTNGTVWAVDGTIINTNSFRFLSVTNSYPVRFFRAKRI